MSTSTATPRLRPFMQLDVFSSEPSFGNPVAVVVDGEGLTTEQMQTFAKWTNLAETTFMLPATKPEADYRVRIFTPIGELPFAGHPTLGTARAWLSQPGNAARSGRIVQECALGLIQLRLSSSRVLSFLAPPPLRSGPISPSLLQTTRDVFGLAPDEVLGSQWVDNGPGWYALLLPSAERVLSLTYDRVRELAGVEKGVLGFVGPYEGGKELLRAKGLLPRREGGDGPAIADAGPHFEVRALVPIENRPEDPVTGSLNAGIAQWLIGEGLAPDSYVASQGTVLGTKGRITITTERAAGDGGKDAIWVGGETVSTIQGQVYL